MEKKVALMIDVQWGPCGGGHFPEFWVLVIPVTWVRIQWIHHPCDTFQSSSSASLSNPNPEGPEGRKNMKAYKNHLPVVSLTELPINSMTSEMEVFMAHGVQ